MLRDLLIAKNRYALAKERYIKAKVMNIEVPIEIQKALQSSKEELDKRTEEYRKYESEA